MFKRVEDARQPVRYDTFGVNLHSVYKLRFSILSHFV